MRSDTNIYSLMDIFRAQKNWRVPRISELLDKEVVGHPTFVEAWPGMSPLSLFFLIFL